MTTLASAPFRAVLDSDPHRVLRIPPPTGRLEKVVTDALKRVALAHKGDLVEAEATIEKYGLTIEVTRLRDRLARAASGDLQRLLLSTPGVTEALFLEAIQQSLDEEEDLEQSDDAASALLMKSLTVVRRSSKRVEESTREMAETMRQVVVALEGLGGKDDSGGDDGGGDGGGGDGGAGPVLGSSPSGGGPTGSGASDSGASNSGASDSGASDSGTTATAATRAAIPDPAAPAARPTRARRPRGGQPS